MKRCYAAISCLQILRRYSSLCFVADSIPFWIRIRFWCSRLGKLSSSDLPVTCAVIQLPPLRACAIRTRPAATQGTSVVFWAECGRLGLLPSIHCTSSIVVPIAVNDCFLTQGGGGFGLLPGHEALLTVRLQGEELLNAGTGNGGRDVLCLKWLY